MSNTEKFTGRANVYDKYRPGYPQELYEFLFNTFNLNEKSVIADIGAGTGKFALSFLCKGIKTVCVEPNSDMKGIMDLNYSKYKNYVGVNASAENTTLLEESVDFITVAQAFHWFDRAVFKQECQRILKPDGKVFLVWNMRDEQAEVTQRLFQVNKKYCKDFKGFTGGISKVDCTQFDDFYKQGTGRVKIFQNDVVYDSLSSFIGRSLSSSYAPKENDDFYNEYVEELKKIYKEYSNKDGLTVQHITTLYYGDV